MENKKQKQETVKFLPLPPQMIEVKRKNYNFTEDKKYPVLQKHGSIACKIKTIDDLGKEVWINEEYFVPAEQILCGDPWDVEEQEESLKCQHLFPEYKPEQKTEFQCFVVKKQQPQQPHNNEKIDNLLWPDIVETVEIPAIRTTDLINRLPNLQADITANTLAGVPIAKNKSICHEFNILAGTTTKKSEEPESNWEVPKAHDWKDDAKNSLLNNIDQMMENMGKVFPQYAEFNSGDCLSHIRKSFPKRKLVWNNFGILEIDGAVTKINHGDVCEAITGLSKVTKTKIAEKIVARTIVKNLKKLF